MDEQTEHRDGEGKGERVEFRPPRSFAPPESNKDEFDLVCTFRKKDDGQICLVKLGDTEMPGYDGKDEKHEAKDNKPDYGDYSKGMIEAGNSQPQGNPGMSGGMGGY